MFRVLVPSKLDVIFNYACVYRDALNSHAAFPSLSLSLSLSLSTALHPSDIRQFFLPAFEQAHLLESAYMNAHPSKRTKIKMPFVTVRPF